MNRPRVLVADDDRHVRCALRARLRQWGYGVIEAADGLRAITQASREQPDALILDQRMPLGDGSTVGRLIRRECAVPTIFISGCGRGIIPDDLLALPDVFHLFKPLDTVALHEILDACMAGFAHGKRPVISFH